MGNSLLVVAGIIFLAISVFQCVKLIKINAIQNLQWPWYLMLYLIIFFLFGYAAYYYTSLHYGNISISSLLISLILFFGSIFVVGILSISRSLIESLTKKTMETSQINNNLIDNTKMLSQKKEELEKTQTQLKEKNQELENTLEDFYTLRLAMQKDIELGRVKKENEKIKERLDELKTQ
jgi:diguanylate cyclase